MGYRAATVEDLGVALKAKSGNGAVYYPRAATVMERYIIPEPQQ
jgi:hypothetical protein